MIDLCDFYQEVIFDYYKWLWNFGCLDELCLMVQGYNLFCGDQVKVSLLVKGDMIEDVCFEGVGCVIMIVLVLLMIEVVKGCFVEEVEVFFENFYNVFIGEVELGDFDLGKFEVLIGVWEYFVWIKCVMLLWYVLCVVFVGDDEQVMIE